MKEQERLRISEVLVVEGKYDAAALAGVVDGLILTTNGFSIFSNEETKDLLRTLGKKRGLVVLTDSDAAGFAIRHYVQKIAGCKVKHAYIPAVHGKEGRKAAPSKEGLLGAEGMPPEVLRNALKAAGVGISPAKTGEVITHTDLYEWGLSGTSGSAKKLREVLGRVGLPARLSKKAVCEVLSSLYTREEFVQAMKQKPVLFWDFHATLSLPDVVWFDAAMVAVKESCPEVELTKETLVKYFSRTCLPWWTIENRDTRHIAGTKAWWKYCEGEFAAMLQQCGLDEQQAKKAAKGIRAHVMNPENYKLYPQVSNVLQTLQKRGYRSFILSNNFPELAQVVQALGIAQYFEQILTSGEIGYEKPRPEIFDTARAAAGNPDEVWMIGDSVNDDICGGASAGFTTVAVHGAKHECANHTVQSLDEILRLLP